MVDSQLDLYQMAIFMKNPNVETTWMPSSVGIDDSGIFNCKDYWDNSNGRKQKFGVPMQL